MAGKITRRAFHIDAEYAGMRLDHFLARQFPQVSRVVLRRATAEARVRVNHRKSKSNYTLRPGDVVDVELDATPHPALTPEPIPLSIVFEDEDILVVDKPAGMLVYPNRTTRSGTLMNALCDHLQRTAPGLRPGLIHRLDRYTSGLLVVAKHERAHRTLAKHFHQRLVTKKYLALVHGRLDADAMDISLPIGWVADAYPHWQIVRGGREAITRMRVLERLSEFTFVEIEPRTGRTHQIRIHLAAIGHPVVGDALYGKRQHETFLKMIEERGIRFHRHFLHATSLAFRHPRSGERVHFTSPLPEDLRRLLEEMKATSPEITESPRR